MKIFFGLILMLCYNLLAAQPASSVNINFKLFCDEPRPVDLDKFCNEFNLIVSGRDINFCNNPYDSKERHYDPINLKFKLHLSTVYSDIILDIIHKTDTMTIAFINSGYGAIFNIDTLVYKAGKYAVACSSRIVDHKTLPDYPVLSISNIDHDAARATYYNFWLDNFLKTRQSLGEASPLHKEFRKLQTLYHIKPEDYEHKTSKQLK